MEKIGVEEMAARNLWILGNNEKGVEYLAAEMSLFAPDYMKCHPIVTFHPGKEAAFQPGKDDFVILMSHVGRVIVSIDDVAGVTNGTMFLETVEKLGGHRNIVFLIADTVSPTLESGENALCSSHVIECLMWPPKSEADAQNRKNLMELFAQGRLFSFPGSVPSLLQTRKILEKFFGAVPPDYEKFICRDEQLEELVDKNFPMVVKELEDDFVGRPRDDGFIFVKNEPAEERDLHELVAHLLRLSWSISRKTFYWMYFWKLDQTDVLKEIWNLPNLKGKDQRVDSVQAILVGLAQFY